MADDVGNIGKGVVVIRFSSARHAERFVYLRDLLRELVARDIKIRYKGSMLGVAWSVLNPVIHLVVFYFLFRLVLNLGISRYSSFALSGILAWNWFQASLSQASGSITGNRDLIKWPGFPAVILPAVAVTTNFFDFLLALPILILLLWFDNIYLHPVMLALPIVLVVQFVLTLSLAYLIATANVIFRDTQHLVGVFLRLLFFLTPVFYDSSVVPDRYQAVYRLNPLVHLMDAYRAVLLKGTLPEWPALLVLALLTGGLVYVGLRLFAQMSYRFVEEL